MDTIKSPILTSNINGCVLYNGPLDLGIKLAERSRTMRRGIVYAPEARNVKTLYEVRLLDDGGTTAEWGRGSSRDIATRYALGALFGPLDSEYDEDALRAALLA